MKVVYSTHHPLIERLDMNTVYQPGGKRPEPSPEPANKTVPKKKK